MATETDHYATWEAGNDAFDANDVPALRALLTDDFEAVMTGVRLASPTEFIAAVVAGRANNWLRQERKATTVRGNLLSLHFENVFADGSRSARAAVMSFAPDGRINAVRTLNNSGWSPMNASGDRSAQGPTPVADTTIFATWRTMMEAGNSGGSASYRAQLAENFTGMAGKLMFESPDAFVAAAFENRTVWTSQRPISVAVGDNLLTMHYRNFFADGSQTDGAGVALFDSDGKVTAIRALNSTGLTAMESR